MQVAPRKKALCGIMNKSRLNFLVKFQILENVYEDVE